MLEEYCTKSKIDKPKYNEEQVDGIGDFITKCSLLSFSASGTNKSKKVSKQLAAKAMYAIILEKVLMFET